MNFLLPFLFFISRMFFINTKDVFFDSSEYITLFSNPNYPQAIISGHFPPHEGYIILFWPLFQFAKLFTSTPALFVIIGQTLLATVAIICFYKIINFLTEKRTALIAAILASLIPLFWITNVTIMMEIVYTSFFFISLYFLSKYITNTKQPLLLHISALCFTFSFITHMLVVLWLPLFFLIVFDKKKEKLVKIFSTFIFYITLAALLNVVFLAAFSNISIPAVFQHLYLTKGNEFAYIPPNFSGVLIVLRNFLIPLLRNNTSLLVMLSVVSLIVLYVKNKKLFIFGLLWIIPAVYANQWWDSLLNGRHALLTSFGFAFLVAHLLRKKIKLVVLVIIYLLFVSLPVMNLLRQPIPYIEESEFLKSLPKNSLVLESHFARPQVQNLTNLRFFFVNEPGFDKKKLITEINNNTILHRPIFISSAALSEPYGLYSGPYLHNITLSYAKPFALEPEITNYTLIPYKTISLADNLILYQIISSKPSDYPQVKLLKNSYRRLDYYDPLARIFWRIY